MTGRGGRPSGCSCPRWPCLSCHPPDRPGRRDERAWRGAERSRCWEAPRRRGRAGRWRGAPAAERLDGFGGRGPGDGRAGAAAGGSRDERLQAARLSGDRLRLAEQVPLAQLDAEALERFQVRRVSMPSASRRAWIRRPNETNASTSACFASSLAMRRTISLVDLDDRRPQRRDEREARVAGAGVVDREAEPEAPERLDLALERDDVLDGLLLGAFERDLARGRGRPPGPPGRTPRPRTAGRAGWPG